MRANDRAANGIEVGLLGAISVRRDGVLEPVAGTRARTLLAALALRPGEFRSARSLIEDVWPAQPPRAPINALHTQVSRLRQLLPGGVLEAGPAGYRLALGRDEVDLTRAEGLLQRARAASRAGDVHGAGRIAREAAALWRGTDGMDLPAEGPAEPLRTAAAALRSGLDELMLDAQLADGEFGEAVDGLAERCDRNPLDERAHEQLMRCLAALGRTNEALGVFAGLRTRLAHELGADPARSLSELNTQLLRGELGPADSQAAAPSRPTVIGLRVEPNPLVGRDDDLAALEALLRSSRVVTILGPGGAGKTRMAHALGARLAGDRPVTLVELAGIRSGEDVLGAVSATLGISDTDIGPDGIRRPRQRDARQRLRDVLGARPMLLILDNCEQVVAACADLVADLVAVSDQLTVLTTSRTPLMISAEVVDPLPPLPVQAGGSPATELFCARARAVRPDAHLDPNAVARLCRTLDGLPLAIELAAARVRTMSVEEINSRIRDRFALLRATDRTTPARHRTLHAVIEWSWNLLDDGERLALRRLGRFPGGFSREAAAVVVGECPDIDSALDGLVNQSLLTITEHPAPVGLRYRMLETVREFGEAKLLPAEADALAQRQQEWAAGLALRVAEVYLHADQLAAIRLAEAEHDNLVAALRSSITAGRPRTALTIFPVLATYWMMRGAHSEVYRWAPRMLAVADDPAGYAGLNPNLLASTHLIVIAHLGIAGASRELGVARMRLRRTVAEHPGLDESVALLARAALAKPDGKGLGRLLAHGVRSSRSDTRCLAYWLRANLQENAGNRSGAWRDAVRGLDLARQRGDRWAQGMAAQLLGSLESQAAHYAEAVGYFRLSAQILRELHAYEESAQVRGFIGAAYVASGQVAAGRREALAALNLQPALQIGGDGARTEHEAAVSATLAEADLAEGRTASGLERYRRAVQQCAPAAGAPFIDPFASLITSAAVCAHALAGQPGMTCDALDALLDAGLARFLGRHPQPVVDLPIMGVVALAVAATDLHDPRWSDDGTHLLAVAVRAGARQDYPSLRHDRHLAAARRLVGDELVEAETVRAAALRRADLVVELPRLLVGRYQALRM